MPKSTHRRWLATFAALGLTLGLLPGLAAGQESVGTPAGASDQMAVLESKELANGVNGQDAATGGPMQDANSDRQSASTTKGMVPATPPIVQTGYGASQVELVGDGDTAEGQACSPDDAIQVEPSATDGGSESDIGLEIQASGTIASGKSGTCTWEIDGSGLLTIRPTSGTEGKLGKWDSFDGDSPWHEWDQYVSSVRIVEKVRCVTCRCMFQGCSSLKSIDLSGLDTSGATDMWCMFQGCSSLKSIDLSGLDTSRVTNMWWMFEGCSSLTSIDLTPLDTSRVTEMGGMFEDCSSLASIDLTGLDTSRVTDMSCMFASCSSLKSIDLSRLDTSRVTDMSCMFASCSSLKSIDLSRLDTSRVTYMSLLFGGCSSLTSIDLSRLDTSRVTDMSCMFERCSSLKSINLKGLDTSRVTYMFGMFSCCSSLRSLDLSGFDTSQVTDMYRMFGSCSSLKSLDLSALDTSKATDMTDMFDGCSSLASFKIGPKYSTGLKGALPSSAKGKWWSVKAQKWYTNKQIASKRTGIADHYMSQGNLAKAKISKIGTKLFTGKAIKPKPGVSVGGTELKASRDYTLAYKNNTAVGTATITIAGRGDYKGTAKTSFRIALGSLSKAKLSGVAAQVESKDGSPVTPAPKVTLGGKTLKAGRDYTLSYKRNTSAGTATVTARGKGNYAGSASAKFTIRATVMLCSVNYTRPARSAKTARLTAVLYRRGEPGERRLKEGRDYTVRFAQAKPGKDYMVATLTGKGGYAGTATVKLKLAG